MHAYSHADLKRLFHLSPALVRSLTRAGQIHPVAGRGKATYSFQDLLVLRAAGALHSAKIPPAKITNALVKLRAALAPGALLSALSLTPTGKTITVQDGARQWEADTGQYALALTVEPPPTPVSRLKTAPPPGIEQAHRHFERALELEDSDLIAARAAYADCLRAQTDHLEARINLGRLLHLSGALAEAETVYRQVKATNAMLSFNLGVLLEDMNREGEAIDGYREALALDPNLHDAHFNLARLHERARQPREALRHLLAYKRGAGRHGEA